MQLKKTKEALNKFAKYVIQQARTNLTKKKKNVSKGLYDSLEYIPYQKGDMIGVKFYMDDYGKFVDKGVKGANPSRLSAKSKYFGKQKAPDSPYQFGKSRGGGLRKGIRKWVRQRGIKGRDKRGRFITRKSLEFLIIRSTYLAGIKPSLFFTKPFERAFKNLPKDLQKNFVNDIEKSIFK